MDSGSARTLYASVSSRWISPGLLTCISRYLLFHLSLSEVIRACRADASTFPPFQGFKSGDRPVISRALGGGTPVGLMAAAKPRKLQRERYFSKEKGRKKEGRRVVGTRTCFGIEFEVWRRNLERLTPPLWSRGAVRVAWRSGTSPVARPPRLFNSTSSRTAPLFVALSFLLPSSIGLPSAARPHCWLALFSSPSLAATQENNSSNGGLK